MTITRTFSHFIVKWSIGTHDIKVQLRSEYVDEYATQNKLTHLSYRGIINNIVSKLA